MTKPTRKEALECALACAERHLDSSLEKEEYWHGVAGEIFSDIDAIKEDINKLEKV